MNGFRTAILGFGMTVVMLSGLTAEEAHASLYQRLGGMPAIRAVVDDYFVRIMADERVNKWFAHAASDPERGELYKSMLADFICQGTGGPCKYTGPDMQAAHRGRGITGEAFDALVGDLTAALQKFNVPEKEKADLLSILGPMRSAVVRQQVRQ
jgi:hemoglobin